MEIATFIVRLEPRAAFRIARARTEPFANVLLRIESDGVVGWGEASPNPHYGETAADVAARLQRLGPWLRTLRPGSVEDIAATWAAAWEMLRPSRAAQCALDISLWDWLAQKRGCSVTELAHGHAPRPVTSFATIGLGSPAERAARLAELRGFPRVKVKSDATVDLAPVREARALGAEVAVDANGAWPAGDIPALSLACAALGVTFIEQPLPATQDGRLLRASYALPIFADESCVVEADVTPLSGHFDGINVKLVKCGGLTPALRMLRRARGLALQTMVGCMLETSVLIAAGCAAAQIADYADLDGAWLVGNDPCDGWEFAGGVLTPPVAPGLGAIARAL